MQCNFVVDGKGAGAIPRMDKNAAIIGKFTLYYLNFNASSSIANWISTDKSNQSCFKTLYRFIFNHNHNPGPTRTGVMSNDYAAFV